MDKDLSEISSDKTSPSSKDESDTLLYPAQTTKHNTPPKNSLYRRSILKRGSSRKTRRRAVFKNGECNTLNFQLSNRSYRFLRDGFTTLVDGKWRWTLLCFSMAFMLSWFGFAILWWLVLYNHGDLEIQNLPEHQSETGWVPCITNINSFTSVLLFSIETQHTIGYGNKYITDECPEAVFLLSLQSMLGVMIQSLMVGLAFVKMSRPMQRTETILFSKYMVVNMIDGELCLMFRVGDIQKSHIIAGTIRAKLLKSKITKEGDCLFMHQEELTVGTNGYNNNLFFIWPLTIIHKINEESPFYHMSPESLLSEKFEIVVMLEGTIESTGMSTQARSSYLPQEILWGHQFETMVSYSDAKENFQIDYSLFNKTIPVHTPRCSAKTINENYKDCAIQRNYKDDDKYNNSKINESKEISSRHDNHNEADATCDCIQASDAQRSKCIIKIPDIDEISDELVQR